MPHHATRLRPAPRAAAIGLAAPAATGRTWCGSDLGAPEAVTEAFTAAMSARHHEDACELLPHDLVHRAMEVRSRCCAVRLERRHPGTSGSENLAVRGTATEDDYRPEAAPEGGPGPTGEVTVVEEPGRLVPLDHPGRDSAPR